MRPEWIAGLVAIALILALILGFAIGITEGAGLAFTYAHKHPDVIQRIADLDISDQAKMVELIRARDGDSE